MKAKTKYNTSQDLIKQFHHIKARYDIALHKKPLLYNNYSCLFKTWDYHLLLPIFMTSLEFKPQHGNEDKGNQITIFLDKQIVSLVQKTRKNC